MRKQLILLLLMTSASSVYAQCTTCNSFKDASVDPDKVIAIKINSMQHDVTLTEVPEDISKFINLKTLWLSSHQIKTINKNVCKLEKLESLSFAENQLKDLPDCIYEMKNLNEIVLLNNEFSEATKEKIKKSFAKANPSVNVMLDM